jgi:hypothetical protein
LIGILKNVTENSVMDYYLKLLKKDKVKFLVNKPKIKNEIRDHITSLKQTEDIHDKIMIAKDLWKILFEAAMVFIDSDKQGYDKLFQYFNEFVEFEELIFASDSFYRDHTLHSLWVYFLGEYLYNSPEFSPIFGNFHTSLKQTAEQADFIADLKYNHIFGEFTALLKKVKDILNFNDSIRCVIALTHDLGYPLKKVSKINQSISTILPYFAISKFGEFSFQYDNIQQFYIENLLELLSSDIEFYIETGDVSFEEEQLIKEPNELIGRVLTKIATQTDLGEEELAQFKDYFDNISDREIHIWRKIFSGTTKLSKSISKLMRYATDFEEYQHGIMSAYLLTKLLNSFSNIKLEYSNPSDITFNNLEIAQIYAKLRIMQAIADHTSPGFQITSFDNYSAILVLVDEIEEFSRISRANQFRQFINEFCKTEIGFVDGSLCIDFIFDDETVLGLNPERAFKDKCKKFMRIFNFSKLHENITIHFRCIGKLPTNTSTYELIISKNQFKITIDGDLIVPGKYLKTNEAFQK